MGNSDTKFVIFKADTTVETEDGATRHFKAGATKALAVVDADRMIAGGLATRAREPAAKRTKAPAKRKPAAKRKRGGQAKS